MLPARVSAGAAITAAAGLDVADAVGGVLVLAHRLADDSVARLVARPHDPHLLPAVDAAAAVEGRRPVARGGPAAPPLKTKNVLQLR